MVCNPNFNRNPQTTPFNQKVNKDLKMETCFLKLYNPGPRSKLDQNKP